MSLAVHDYPRFNTLRVAGDSIAGFAAAPGEGSLAFTGLHVLDPEILETIAPARPSCIIDHYRRMLADGGTIAALRVDGSFWTDMGTPEDYLALHGGLLGGRIPRWPEMGGPVDSPFLIAAGARLAADLAMEDWCCLGDVEVAGDVRLARVVAWDKVRIAAGSRLADQLLSS